MEFLTIVEATAVALNLVYVVLAIREKILCWPFGIAASLISIWFFVEIRLFAEAILFIYYVLVGFYGWWVWANGKRNEPGSITVLKRSKHTAIIGIGLSAAVLLGYVLSRYTAAASPFFDSFTTIFSFIATLLTARKILENWTYWIVVDIATIFLYGSKGAYIYAGLSAVYTVMAIYGLMEWSRNYRAASKVTA